METSTGAPDDIGINQWLKDKYGYTVDGHSIWRIVWGNRSLIESREGTFDIITDSGIFLRQEKGVREVPKYRWVQNRWILEKINIREKGTEDIKTNETFTYEGIYVFETKKREFLPLNRGVIEILIYFYLHKDKFTKDGITRRNELEDEINSDEEAEKEHIRQLIGENMQVPHLMELIW